jgi:hypothetical protein
VGTLEAQRMATDSQQQQGCDEAAVKHRHGSCILLLRLDQHSYITDITPSCRLFPLSSQSKKKGLILKWNI